MRSMAPARTPVKSAADTPRPGLRERKKIRTRQAIRHAAYRLFDEQGYDATPVDRIAEEAEVSPSTVFRYFPTKEDIVLTDEYDPMLHDALLARPADEPPVTALRRAMLEVFEQAMRQEPGREPAESHQRMRLVREVPAVRARMAEHMSATEPVPGERALGADRDGRGRPRTAGVHRGVARRADGGDVLSGARATGSRTSSTSSTARSASSRAASTPRSRPGDSAAGVRCHLLSGPQ